MKLRAVYLGHWRSLEKKWLEESGHFSADENTAVVTAGQQQSERLASLLPGTTAGIRFFPGIPKFAEAVSNSISVSAVPEPSAVALAFLAGYSAVSAPSAAGFFEKLLDNGINAEQFHLSAMSIKPLDNEVTRTANLFLQYEKLRNTDFPCTPDSVVRKGPYDSHRYRTVVFYGFYDLNPGQRRFIKRLCAVTDLIWFSPVHRSSQWSSSFKRTLDFLEKLPGSENRFSRTDLNISLSEKAQFAENMLLRKALVRNNSVHLITCGSGTAFTSAVVRQIEGLSLEETAVVASGEEAEKIKAELYSRSIPCSADLMFKACHLPCGAFVKKLVALGDTSFHNTEIKKLLSYGMITAEGAPGPSEYAARVVETGGRFGIEGLRATGFSFAGYIADFFTKLPETDDPKGYLRLLTETLRTLCPDSLPEYIFDQILKEDLFSVKEKVVYPVFRQMLDMALEQPVKAAEKNRNGIRIVSPEQIRGCSYRTVILTGLEEGRFPGKTANDPRLPVRMKNLLQLSSPDNREQEDAFLLRQVFESAQEKLIILLKTVDEKGNAVSPSHFIAPLTAESSREVYSLVTREDNTVLPSETLIFPEDPPFLSSSLASLKEHISYDPENPRRDQKHSGVIGPGFYDPQVISATTLENYHRNRFSFMEKKLWKVQEPESFPVRSEPDSLNRGSMIHNCVETVLATGRAPADVVAELSRSLEIMLGSSALADIWRASTVKGIEALQKELDERKLCYRDSEISLRGTIAGYAAAGRIDLIFTTEAGSLVLADLKTGREPSWRTLNPVKLKLFQLPFYYELAKQNLDIPVTECLYIYLQSSGNPAFREIAAERLEEQQNDFHQLVTDTVKAMKNGMFPMEKL
ncbi:hypothetical protein CSA37_01360 [Candidatus Fermentibacteria bacterium]|nr:MAG: hypothetical protein CSA37_01360 [Candidatus Fermentibacteria bacterium]